MVLEFNPEFPQAVVSKAHGLVYMIKNTSCAVTLSLITEIYARFKQASEMPIILNEIKSIVFNGLRQSSQFLEEMNFDFESLPNQLELNLIEYQSHNEEIRYYLDNFLSLSEHALYCKCKETKIDNLIIDYHGFSRQNKKIVQLELLLNRIKSEFSLSRRLYYDYRSNEEVDNVHYENLNDNILTGISHEKLRTSFRLCFGTLDKIAEGICYLYDLKIKKGENICFESFWSSRNANSERWNKINSLNNLHLTALYSMACDLSAEGGEFNFYKKWRNRLEHGVFNLTRINADDTKLFMESLSSENAEESDFENKAKHLIQLTRAAIFSFVFCVRQDLAN